MATTTISYFHKDFMKRFQHVTLFSNGLPTFNAEEGGLPDSNGITPATSTNAKEEPFEIVHINDFASEQIKAENQHYEEQGELTAVAVCPAYHGGPLDYPKLASASSANTTEKWDYCYDQLEAVILARVDKRKTRPNSSSNYQRSNSDEEVYEKLTGDSSLRRKKVVQSQPQLLTEDLEAKVNEEEFFSAISESTSKMIIHNTTLSKVLLTKGDMGSMFRVLGGLALVRNKLWHYNEHILVQGQARPFRDQYSEVCQLLEALSAQVLEYHSALAATTVLHDPASHDWGSHKPFYEGEKVSHCVQMWWYFLQGLRLDLWRSVPPKTARTIFAGVFGNSLGVLAARYLRISPSAARLPQYRGDVTAILLASAESLASICGTVDQIMVMDVTAADARGVHDKCGHLMTALAVVSSPLDDLCKAVDAAVTAAAVKTKKKSKNVGKANEWMGLLRHDLYSGPGEAMSASAHVSLLSKLVVSQPEPSWPLLVQTVLCRDMAVARLVMRHFGTFESDVVNGDGGGLTGGCGGYECAGECVGAADDVSWPQYVGAAVLQVCADGLRDPMSLCSLLNPLLKTLSAEAWESALGKTSLTNPRKSVIFEAICQTLEPPLQPVLHELFSMIEAGKAWRISQVSATVKEILLCLHDVVPMIPHQVLLFTSHLDKTLPSAVKPLCKNALTHLLISSLHSTLSRLLPLLRNRRLAKEKLDFIAAFAEALCGLDPSVELLTIQNVADQVMADYQHGLPPGAVTQIPERTYDDVGDVSLTVAEVVANEMLADPAGAFALKALFRFVCYNAEWIAQGVALSGSPSSSSSVVERIPVLIRPWGSEIYPPVSPYDMMNQIGAFWCGCSDEDEDRAATKVGDGVAVGNGVVVEKVPNFRFDKIMLLQHPWDSYLKHVLQHGNPILTSRLMSRRPEVTSDEAVGSERNRLAAAIKAWDEAHKIGSR